MSQTLFCMIIHNDNQFYDYSQFSSYETFALHASRKTHTRLDYATRPLLFTPSHMVIFILTKETLCNCIVTATATTLYICISQTNQYILVLQNDLIQS